MSIAESRLERIVDERARNEQNINDTLKRAEDDGGRDLTDAETDLLTDFRDRIAKLDMEAAPLIEDIERANNSKDVSKLIRVTHEPAPDPVMDAGQDGPVVYRTFSRYAVDKLIAEHPRIADAAAADRSMSATTLREQAVERLERTLQHTLSTDVAGLVPPQHMAQIMDLINTKRPIVATARQIDLSRGKLTYPHITGRPVVAKQGTQKTEGGTIKMQVELADTSADTFIGGGNLSWQTINWSTPDALQLWFDLCAESYAQQTETHAGTVLEGATSGTVSPALGTAGTESFADWRSAVIDGVGEIYTTTAGRAQTNTLYLAADQFFYLAGLSTDAVVQMSAVGNVDLGTLTGTFSGLRVVGSYGLTAGTRIIGDGNAFLIGESPGAPVELRAVEPSIGGLEVGLIGAFQAKVFDPDRFLFLS